MQHPLPPNLELEFTQRILRAQETYLAANPQSAQAARDVLVSHYQLAHFHAKAGDAPSASTHLEECFAILDAFAQENRPMDGPMRDLYDQLKPMFAPAQ